MSVRDILSLSERRVTTSSQSRHTTNHLHLLITHTHQHQHGSTAWTGTRSSALSKCVRALIHIHTYATLTVSH